MLGVAAFVGVAATGVLVARGERRHQDYTPEEIRERLHARAAEAGASAVEVGALEGDLGPVPPADAAEPTSPDAATAHPARRSLRSRAGGARRRVATGVTHVRTRLGMRPRPTRRRRARAERTAP